MNKAILCAVIVDQLEVAVNSASAAADQARDTATDKQNVAENKYDTLGLEAAYLAHGQSERVVQLTKALDDFRELQKRIQPHALVEIGSLVSLQDDSGSARYVFIGPAAGGHMVTFENLDITVITASSPLGQSLMTLSVDDEVVTGVGAKTTNYLISDLW
ncbi:MAG: transcription elongation GreA/GreB family factor [Candidatus Azotimanducaceae bacterium]|jgi:transcription elongation GreA/GreB family factor